MTDPKFTPGRWEFIHSMEVVSHIPESNEHEVIHICYWQSDNVPKEEQQANARLIAQAPNMYHALKNARVKLEKMITTEDLIQRIDDILAMVDGDP